MTIGTHIARIRRGMALTLCAIGLLEVLGMFVTPAQAKTRLFGTVEFQMDLKKQQNWLSAIARNGKHPIFFDEKRFNSSTLWKDLKKRASDKPLMEKLNIVNKFWNMWPYRTDKEFTESKIIGLRRMSFWRNRGTVRIIALLNIIR